MMCFSMPRCQATIKGWAAAGCLSILLGGCASGATSHGMTATPADLPTVAIEADLQGTIGLSAVTGGEDTNPLWTSEVGNEEFKGALRNSLEVQRLYSGAADSRYLLDVHLMNLDQPLIGFDTTVTSTVKYVLTERATRKPVLEEVVVSEHTTKLAESWYGVERLRVANEGSIRTNIAEFIRRLMTRLSKLET